MLPPEPSAWLFTAAAVAAAGLHILLILGLPIGFMTMGGRNPGVLPPSARLASLFQAVLVLGLAWIVLSAAGVVPGAPLPGFFILPLLLMTYSDESRGNRVFEARSAEPMNGCQLCWQTGPSSGFSIKSQENA